LSSGNFPKALAGFAMSVTLFSCQKKEYKLAFCAEGLRKG